MQQRAALYHCANALAMLRAAERVPHRDLLLAHARVLEQRRAGAKEASKVSALHPWQLAKRLLFTSVSVFGFLSTLVVLRGLGDFFAQARQSSVTIPIVNQRFAVGGAIPPSEALDLLARLPKLSYEQAGIAAAAAAGAVLTLWISARFFSFRRGRLLKEEQQEIGAVLPVLLAAAEAPDRPGAEKILVDAMGTA